MKYTKKFIYEQRYILTAFFLSALLTTITYIIRQIFPFGDRTILRVDLFHQYAPYLEELRSRLQNGQSLLYSWEGGLGKDFLAQSAYYTASPLALLILLFPQKMISEAVAILILLKISLGSASFTYYIKKHFQRNDLSILIFGLLYGFCAFVTCYYWNIMWLDTVVLFPLVALGTEMLVSRKKGLLYYVALTLTMIVNFYLAVLVCILISFYFLVILFSQYRLRKDIKTVLRIVCHFALLSVLSAMSAAFILIPVALALGQTAASDAAFPNFEVYTNVFQLLTNHFLGAKAAVLARNQDLPNIYSGVLTMALLPFYFFNKDIRRREKWLLSLFLGLMLLCSCIKPLDFLIHGLHFPANLPHRYTFVYSFVLLYIAYSGFLHLGGCRLRPVLITYIVYAVIICITEFGLIHVVSEIDRVLSNGELALNLVLLLVYLAVLWKLRQPHRRKSSVALLLLLLACTTGECLYSSVQNLEQAEDRAAYIQYIDDTKEAIASLDEREEGNFYRTEFRRFTTINDASLYHYNGFSQFSSLAPGGISSLMQSLGIAATSNSYRYYDPTPLIDSIFGLKYIMNKGEAHPKAYKYSEPETFGSVWVYENKRALPLGFLVTSKLADWQTEDSQPFAVQNDFVKKAAGIHDDMFTVFPADDISCTYMNVTENSGPEDFHYELTDPADLSLNPTVTAEYTSDKDQYLYLYVSATNAQRFIYQTNSVREDRELSAGNSLIDVGYVSAGEKIHVEFTLTKKGEFEKTYRKEGSVKLYAASYDDTVFQEAYDLLSTQPYTISEFTDTRVTGSITASGDGILFTSIPYIDNWEVSVDGEPAEKLAIGGGLIGVNLPIGTHEVTFQYHASGIIPAILLSLVGIGLFVLYYWRVYVVKPKTDAERPTPAEFPAAALSLASEKECVTPTRQKSNTKTEKKGKKHGKK